MLLLQKTYFRFHIRAAMAEKRWVLDGWGKDVSTEYFEFSKDWNDFGIKFQTIYKKQRIYNKNWLHFHLKIKRNSSFKKFVKESMSMEPLSPFPFPWVNKKYVNSAHKPSFHSYWFCESSSLSPRIWNENILLWISFSLPFHVPDGGERNKNKTPTDTSFSALCLV